MLAENRC